MWFLLLLLPVRIWTSESGLRNAMCSCPIHFNFLQTLPKTILSKLFLLLSLKFPLKMMQCHIPIIRFKSKYFISISK